MTETDWELVARYVAGEREAFGELVRRHVDLVYAAARRQAAGQADDVTQAVFMLLARKAKGLKPRGSLAGWLYGATRMCCMNVRRGEARRQFHERRAAVREAQLTEGEMDEACGLLDEGLAKLGGDREAVLLRYLKQESYDTAGAALGISEEAARKRASRGMEKLRQFFVKRGYLMAVGAVIAVTEKAAQAKAPVALAQSVMAHGAQVSSAAGSTAAVKILEGVIKMMGRTKILQATAVAAILAALGLGGWALSQAWAQGTPMAAAVPRVPAATGAALMPAVATAPAAAVNVDRSSPLATIKSLSQAIQDGNRPAIYACLAVDPAREPTAVDWYIVWNIAEHRLMRANEKAFGTYVMRTMMGLDEGLDGLAQMNEVKINGETAQVLMAMPARLAAQMPPQTPNAEWAWGRGMLRFKKVGANWLLDADVSLHVETGMPEGPEKRKLEVAMLQETAAAVEDAAARVERGEFKTSQAMVNQVVNGLRALQRKYQFSSAPMGVAIVPEAAPDVGATGVRQAAESPKVAIPAGGTLVVGGLGVPGTGPGAVKMAQVAIESVGDKVRMTVDGLVIEGPTLELSLAAGKKILLEVHEGKLRMTSEGKSVEMEGKLEIQGGGRVGAAER